MEINELRMLSGLSQQAFSDKYKIPKRTIENWEGGKRNPSVGTARRIGKVLGIEWFLIFEKE